MNNLFNLDINKIKYGGNEVVLIKLGGNIIYEANDERGFCIQYAVDYTWDDNYSLADKALPLIYSDKDNYSYDGYEDIIITKKDDTITKDTSISLREVKYVTIYYPKTTYSVAFADTLIHDRVNSRTTSPIKSIDYVNISNFGSTSHMFNLLHNITELDTKDWKTSNITDMSYMFGSCYALQSLDVSNWKTGKVTDMCEMFNGCSSLQSLNVSNWDVGNVTNMSGMFGQCALTSLDVSNWNTSKVTDMSYMFALYFAPELNLSGLNVSNVTNMSHMFSQCSSSSINIDGWAASKVTNMSYMFYNCSSLIELDLSSFDVSNVINTSGMFTGCSSLTTLNLSGWDMTNVRIMSSMFSSCNSLHKLYLNECDSNTIRKIINSCNLPTNAISGVTRTIYCKSTAVSNLTPPTNWVFSYIDIDE